MGSYLSKPIVDKESQDVENGLLVCGVSSMQGWREAQEDAHNCILDFDKNISLFAVYDGHGGAEVAQYAAENLPSLVKNELYEKEDYEKALIQAYLKFDDSLIEPDVADKLSALRVESNEAECDEVEDEDKEKEEELNELYKEAKMPIEEIILKYKNKILREREILKSNDEPGSSKGSKSKSIIEVELDNECGSTSSLSDEDKNNLANGVDDSKWEDNDEIMESSSNNKINGTPKDETNGTEDNAVENSESKCGPSSSKEQNGSEKRSTTACLISADSESDDDDDDDDDDDMFIAPSNYNDESNSEDSDDDPNEGDDDSILMDDDDEEKPGKDSGCTAVMALLVNNKLYVANAGDSRCVVSIDGKAHDMSKDHKPEDEPEFTRIKAAGGRVSNDGRVNGGLNLSRALGDHNYKKNDKLPNTEQMITALPDVSVLDIKPENDIFLVLACDGIWNSLNSQEVVDFISERINKPDVKLSSICEELFDTCLAPDTLSDGTGCDNMTCIIVKVKQNPKRSRSEDEGDKCVDNVECKKLKLDSTESESVH